jgi:hypothetical protein
MIYQNKYIFIFIFIKKHFLNRVCVEFSMSIDVLVKKFEVVSSVCGDSDSEVLDSESSGSGGSVVSNTMMIQEVIDISIENYRLRKRY